MARGLTSAQHFLECDNCEENPAKFLCKTCTGHLCELCKSEHEMKKITRNHEILPLDFTNEEMLDLLVCPNHEKKKVECYCTSCSEPVCTECIVQSHNGHSVKSLSIVYKEFTSHSKEKKERIENVLLPMHIELLAKEKEKRSAFRKKALEIQENIDAHTQKIVDKVKYLRDQTVGSLRKAEKNGLRDMGKFEERLEEKINKLHLLSNKISANLEAKPQFSIFKSIHIDDLKGFETLPSPGDYTLTECVPQNIDIENIFGKPPVLNIGHVQKEEKPVNIDVENIFGKPPVLNIGHVQKEEKPVNIDIENIFEKLPVLNIGHVRKEEKPVNIDVENIFGKPPVLNNGHVRKERKPRTIVDNCSFCKKRHIRGYPLCGHEVCSICCKRKKACPICGCMDILSLKETVQLKKT